MWIEFNGARVIFDSARKIALQLVAEAPACVDFRRVRIEFQSVIVIGQRVLEIAQRAIDIGAIHIGHWLVWIQFNSA